MQADHGSIGTSVGNSRLLTVSEVARLLGAHVNSVRRWSNMGLLNSYRIGVRGNRRFRPEDLAEFLGSHEKPQRNGTAVQA